MLNRDRHARPLREEDLPSDDPLAAFAAWFREAAATGIRAPEAAAIATADADGAPSVRMVLVKRFDERGFVFHTHYRSRKARELAENPRAALLFYWDVLGRQVRIEGRVGRLGREESEAYFRTRPRGGQLGAWASRQSEPLASRDELEKAVREVERRFAGGEVALPPEWGGFLLAPAAYEFWQHRDDRLHDRLRYDLGPDGWRRVRLAP